MLYRTENIKSFFYATVRVRLGAARILGAVALLATLTMLAACATIGSLGPKDFGKFECHKRSAMAVPPSKHPPMPGAIDPRECRKPHEPLLTLKLCPEGQVPIAAPATPNVAKGNPLIGQIKGSVEEFFGAPTEQATRIRRQLRSLKEFYIHGPATSGMQPVMPDPPGCNGVSYYNSCFYYGSASYSRQADGGGMTMTIEKPAYDGSGGSGHSLDEIAVQGGSGNGNIVELGWNVSTSQYSNANPHLFVFHWKAWAPTCYDTCGWNQYSATYFPGMDLGALAGRQVYIGYVFYQGNWWAWFDNQWLGYFPGSEWEGKYTQNSLIQWFGEVATNNGIPPHTDMGDGQFPTSSNSAINETLCDVNAVDWVCWYRDQQTWGATYPSYYDINRTGFGQTRYGGPGE